MTISVVWRAASQSLDVESILRLSPKLRFDEVWRQGDPRLRGMHSTSGVQKHIGDFSDARSATHSAIAFIRDNDSLIQHLNSRRVQSNLDFALFIGDNGSFTTAITISSVDAAFIGSSGVSLTISAYPVTDDDDD